MRIIEMMEKGEPFISFEFFPPKERGEWPAFFKSVEKLAQVNPLFASVTYGAGGSTKGETLEIVSRLKREHGLETMAHLTCVGAYRGEVQRFLDALAEADIHNVLALRGDRPKDAPLHSEFSACRTLMHASDLTAFIRESHPGMGIGVAGYPETHPEAADLEEDLAFLKKKMDQGADFIITQLFFDNQYYFEFVRKARAMGVNQPIIPGILPVVNLKVIQRIISLCGASIPPDLLAELEEADRRGGAAAVQEVGVGFARRQAEALFEWGAPGLHLYTLNRDEAVLSLIDGLLPEK